MYWRIAILFHFYIIVYLHSLIYIYMDIQEYQHIYIGIVPFRQFSPCTALLCIPQTRRNRPGAKLLFTPEQQGREVEHSSGALRTTPHTTDAAHFPGCHQKVRLVLFLRSWTLHELHRENEAYFLPLPHGLKTTRKEYGILYLCLYLYCRIVILLYCCISVLSYYSLYLLFAIRLYIFFYIYISVSVSYVQPQFFSIGCAVNHHRQLFNVQRYGSPGRHQTPVDALPIGEDFLQQTSAIRDGVFYKKSLPIVWLTALLGCHLLKHVKRLRWWRLCRNDSKKKLGLNETESP